MTTPSLAVPAHDASPQATITDRLSEFPWWVLFILFSAAILVFNFATNATYGEVLNNLIAGVRLTVFVTLTAYAFAISLGLITALGQLSPRVSVRNVATLYVQIIRGVPIIVQIFYTALVIVPAAVAGANALGVRLADAGILGVDNALVALSIRDVDFVTRGIIALAISYGAFSSEIFRAGIQSIEKGQLEAAQSLGLSRLQSLRLIILPQAVRRVLPPLGNDFIAMLKESSLVSVLGVDEVTHLSRKYAAASFRYVPTYNTLAFIYLSMTLVLSMGVKFMERKLKTAE
ncbi:MAG: amino acid ABC transporter permease [Anaerolineales bacterium]